jgi:hypothetical protein
MDVIDGLPGASFAVAVESHMMVVKDRARSHLRMRGVGIHPPRRGMQAVFILRCEPD